MQANISARPEVSCRHHPVLPMVGLKRRQGSSGGRGVSAGKQGSTPHLSRRAISRQLSSRMQQAGSLLPQVLRNRRLRSRLSAANPCGSAWRTTCLGSEIWALILSPGFMNPVYPGFTRIHWFDSKFRQCH